MNDLDGSLNRINVVLNRPNPFKSLKPDVESVYDWFESGWKRIKTRQNPRKTDQNPISQFWRSQFWRFGACPRLRFGENPIKTEKPWENFFWKTLCNFFWKMFLWKCKKTIVIFAFKIEWKYLRSFETLWRSKRSLLKISLIKWILEKYFVARQMTSLPFNEHFSCFC